MVVGELNSYIQKNEVGYLPHNNNNKNLKMDQSINIRTKIIKLLEETKGWLWIWQCILRTSEVQAIKEKIHLLYQNKNFCD